MKILVLHGINLDMFGKRDPAQYGTATLDDINASLQQLAQELGVKVTCFQTNHEGEIRPRRMPAHKDTVRVAAALADIPQRPRHRRRTR